MLTDEHEFKKDLLKMAEKKLKKKLRIEHLQESLNLQKTNILCRIASDKATLMVM